MDISHRVKDYIVNNYLGGDGGALADDTPLTELNILDSTSMLELVHFLRDELSVRVSLEDVNAENFRSIQTICQLVARNSRS